jgi:bifunctional non-homologous end joining protein LigD
MALKTSAWAKRALSLRDATRRAVQHRAVEPAPLTMHKSPPEGDSWLHEIKWDGFRLVATLVAGRARLWSRQAVGWTERLGPITRAIEALPVNSAIVDGELIAGGGRQADFNVLTETIAARETDGLSFVLFDLLNVEGVDITAASTLERRTLLAALLGKPIGRLALSTHLVGQPEAAMQLARREGFEGIVSKPVDAPYPHRKGVWTKAKTGRTEPLGVIGTHGRHALLARAHDGAWHYAGRAHLPPELEVHLCRPTSACVAPLTSSQRRRLAQAQWFEPGLIVEVDHHAVNRGRDGFRHMRILRRADPPSG